MALCKDGTHNCEMGWFFFKWILIYQLRVGNLFILKIQGAPLAVSRSLLVFKDSIKGITFDIILQLLYFPLRG